MNRVAFKMKLDPGQAEEYKKRHDALWPELKKLIKDAGISHYSIFLDDESNVLFAVLDIQDIGQLSELPNHTIMKKWWAFMKDIMDTNADNSPVSKQLQELFYLD
jgi:L-rhamnose mutarotase